MREFKVGEKFEIDFKNEKILVEVTDEPEYSCCGNCVFKEKNSGCSKGLFGLECCAIDRNDLTDVIFKKVENGN